MTSKTPANEIAEIVVSFETRNDSAQMQIDSLQNEIQKNIQAIETLTPLAQWVSNPTP